MRVLYVSRAAPDANGRGVNRRAAQHLAALQKLGAVTLVLPAAEAEAARGEGLDFSQLGLERLIVRNEPTRAELSERAYKSAKTKFGRLWYGLKLTYWVNQTALPVDAARRREEIGGGYALLFAFRMSSAVWIDSVMGWTDVRPPASVVDFDDIESIASRRIWRQERASPFYRFMHWRFGRWLARLEKRLARTWSLVMVCSETDAAVLKTSFGVQAAVVPNSVTFLEAPRRSAPGSAELLFVGTLNYAPNVNGLSWFVEHVWPEVHRRLAGAVRLNIVGIDAGPQVLALASNPGVSVLGRVTHLAPLYANATLIVAPVFSGGGTRIKLIEAMAYAKAIVTTTIGCEGLDLKPDHDALVADTADGFADAIIRLIGDRDFRDHIAENGWRRGRHYYSREIVQAGLLRHLEGVLSPSLQNP